jgi:hypothetical protein
VNRTLPLTLVAMCLAVSAPRSQPAPHVLSGRISDSICGASHQAHQGLTARQCVFACLKSLAKWVLVADDNRVFVIANYDLPGLPLYAGRPVRLTGELAADNDGAILASKVEAYPPHLHVFHVMTNWRDTPGGVGFLIAAISDARVAAIHANLATKSAENLDDMKLHAGHALHALDPGVEPKGPGSGYGVKKASAGAQQHLDLAAKAEGATDNVKIHATQVSVSLLGAVQGTNAAIAMAQRIRAATTAADAAPLVDDLETLTTQIADGLAQAQTRMTLMMKGEGIESAPR